MVVGLVYICFLHDKERRSWEDERSAQRVKEENRKSC
jgi:hypothetical protein